jgi:hypothetical protein
MTYEVSISKSPKEGKGILLSDNFARSKKLRSAFGFLKTLSAKQQRPQAIPLSNSG